MIGLHTGSIAAASRFEPSKFFAGGANGLWYRFSDIDTLYQDTSTTVPVTADNDPVGAIADKSGNDVNGLQAVSGERVSFQTSPNRINFDKVDDNIAINFGAAFSGTVYINTDDGLLSYEINVPSGVWQLPVDPLYLHSNGFREIIAVARAASETDYNLVRQYMGAGVFAPAEGTSGWFAYRSDIVSFFDYSLNLSNGTNFQNTWYSCSNLASFPLLDVSSGTAFQNAWGYNSSLVSFPLLDVSSGTIFSYTWRDCSSLASFPLLDVSKGIGFNGTWQGCSSLVSFPLLDVSSGNSFQNTWRLCSSLVNFPAPFFDNCLATEFGRAFANTNLSQESIDGILVSINSNATSNGTFNQSGGNAPSAVGRAAILAMRARGWDITVTGGF